MITVYDTLWLFNIAIENGYLIIVTIVDFPIKNGDFP
jgi:hypothetical protein